jgi:hypothetical protein
MSEELPDWKLEVLNAIFLLSSRSLATDKRLGTMLNDLKSIDQELSLHSPETTNETQ